MGSMVEGGPPEAITHNLGSHRRPAERPEQGPRASTSCLYTRQDEAPARHTRHSGASFRWRNLGILSSKSPGGAFVESVRRHPRAGTRIRLVLFPSGLPVGSPRSFVGAAAAASDLATVSLGPNTLTSSLDGGVPPFEPMANVPEGSPDHLYLSLMRPFPPSMVSVELRAHMRMPRRSHLPRRRIDPSPQEDVAGGR